MSNLKQGFFFQPEEPQRRAPARKPVPRWLPWALVAVVAITAAVILIPRLMPAAPSWTAADLVGNWATADNAMTAEVTPGRIAVYWNSDGTQALYWAGSFPVPGGPDKTKTVTSAAAPENQTAIMASSDPQKVFTVTRNGISFSVTALGMTKQTTLKKVK